MKDDKDCLENRKDIESNDKECLENMEDKKKWEKYVEYMKEKSNDKECPKYMKYRK